MDKFYSLGFRLNKTSYALAKALRVQFNKNNIDLPHSQFIVLRMLYYKDALSQQEIAGLLYKDAAAIKRTIDNLEQKGLVKREQVSQRENAIVVTEKGKEIAPVAIRCADAVLDKVLASIDEQDINLLYSLLDEIYENAENIEQECI